MLQKGLEHKKRKVTLDFDCERELGCIVCILALTQLLSFQPWTIVTHNSVCDVTEGGGGGGGAASTAWTIDYLIFTLYYAVIQLHSLCSDNA